MANDLIAFLRIVLVRGRDDQIAFGMAGGRTESGEGDAPASATTTVTDFGAPMGDSSTFHATSSRVQAAFATRSIESKERDQC
jgi:hypothetical protein